MKTLKLGAIFLVAAACALSAAAQAEDWQPKKSLVKTDDVVKAAEAGKKPNILIIWGDDIGWFDIGAYHRGMMGSRTPSIDRIAAEGMLFTDSYGEQSCTAGRSAFILGQHPYRTGLTKVGMPGAKEGISEKDPTIAELLKKRGYRTGQFGKNHLGDRDEHLPSNHGFDEFFGSLYHLNAEDEPEHEDYPKDPAFRKRFGPRGVIHSFADGKIEDTGPLTKKRMEHVDQEFTDAAIDFMDRAHKAEEPFFVWFNATRMHVWTRLPKEYEGKTGYGIYADGLAQHDDHVGMLLKKLDDMGLADNTIVMYSTDTGAEKLSWPDGGTTPFRGEKATTFEGGMRVPTMVRWPGRVPAGTISNGMLSHQDWMPTLLAAAGDPDVKQKLLKGHSADGKKFKVHLDGYNQLDMFLGNGPSAREELFYFNDDGLFAAIRYQDWKIAFAEQHNHGVDVWQKEFTRYRLPIIYNLKTDPFEHAPIDGMGHTQWTMERFGFVIAGSQMVAGKFIATFKDYPQRQKIGTFSLDHVMETMQGR